MFLASFHITVLVNYVRLNCRIKFYLKTNNAFIFRSYVEVGKCMKWAIFRSWKLLIIRRFPYLVKFDYSNKHYLIILSIFQIAFLDERGLRNPNCTVRSRCCYLFSRFIKSHRYVCGHYVLQFWYVCSHYFCSSLLVSVVITYVLQCWYVCGHYRYLFSSVLVCLWSLLITYYFLQYWLIWRSISTNPG